MNSIGAKLKVIRTACGATKHSYSKKLGVAPRTLARWEKDQIEVPDDVAGQMYQDLDLILDVVDVQQRSGELEVLNHLHQVPTYLAERGCDVQMWNQCLVYTLIHSDIQGSGVSARWVQDRA